MLPILYVEDSEDDAFFMEMAFKTVSVPNPLIIVSNGQKAIDYLRGGGDYADRATHPLPCLMLLDLNLPIKSGFEVLQWIRCQPVLKELKVVVVSASGQQFDIDNATRYGVIDYVIKPSVLSELIGVVRARIAQWLED